MSPTRAISFETEPPTAAEMAARIAARDRLVRARGRRRASSATPTPARFHPRAAYRWACEVSVYLELRPPPHRRRPRALRRPAPAPRRARLPDGDRRHDAAQRGQRRPARALGFEPVGTYRDIGYKYGAWHDVAWTQKTLATGEVFHANR